MFHSDSPRPSATGLPKDRVRCVKEMTAKFLLEKLFRFRSDSPRPSATGLSKDRVCCVTELTA